MNLIRALFILAAIPFSLIAGLWLFLDHGSGRAGGGILFAACGGIFIFGSIFSLRRELPLQLLAFYGSLLCLIGSGAWVPELSKDPGSIIGYAGVILSLLWGIAIIAAYHEEAR